MARQMKKRHQHLLSKHMTFLQENVVLVGTFYGSLVEKGIFTDEMIEKIKVEKVTTEKVFRLVTLLKSAGPEAFEKFIRTCEDTGQQHIADTLRQADIESLENIPYDKARQVELIIEKTLGGDRAMRIIGIQKKAELVKHLVLKTDYEKQKEDSRICPSCSASESKVNKQAQDIKELEGEINDTNSKLTKVLGLNKQHTEEIKTYEMEIKELTRKLDETSKQEQEINQDVKSTQTDFDTSGMEQEIDDKNVQLEKLEERLRSQDNELHQMRGKLCSCIKERDSAIKEANEQLSPLCETELKKNNDTKERQDNDKHILLLEINVNFVVKKIERIQQDLMKANTEIISLQDYERMCLNLMGAESEENSKSLLKTLQNFLNENKVEQERQRARIGELKEVLSNTLTIKSGLEQELESINFDKASMKGKLKLLKKQLSKTSHPSHGSPTTLRTNKTMVKNNLVFVEEYHAPIESHGIPQCTTSQTNSSGTSHSDDSLMSLPRIPGSQMHSDYHTLRKSTSFPDSLVKAQYNTARRIFRSNSVITNPFSRTEASVCINCQTPYREEDNHDNACKYHPKTFSKSPRGGLARWQCCFKSSQSTIGCQSGRHCLPPHN